MNLIFADTVGLLALWNESDQWHGAATKALTVLRSQGAFTLLTTPYVLAECGNAASRLAFRSTVDDARQRFEQANALITPTEAEWASAWAAYRRGHPGDPGIVDHVSFQIMRRMGITKALTNDRHFKVMGFETLF